MTSSSSKSSIKFANRDRWSWGACAVIGFAIGYAGCHTATAQEVSNQQTELRESAPLPTLKQVNDSYVQPPAGKNAADLYAQAIEVYKPLTAEQLSMLPAFNQHSSFPAADKAYSSEMLKLMRDHVSANAECLALLHKATALPEARYPVDLTKGYQAELFSVGKLYRASVLLSLDARLKVEQGDTVGATEAYIDMLAIARSLEAEPVLVTQFARTTIRRHMAKELADVLSRRRFDDESLSKLQVALKEVRTDLKPLRRAMEASFAMDLALYEGTARDLQSAGVNISEQELASYRETGALERDRQHFLQLQAKVLAVYDSPIHDIKEAATALDRQIASNAGKFAISDRLIPGSNEMSMMSYVYEIALMRAIEVIVAVERYRLAEGVLPMRLSDLTPRFIAAISADPYTNKPLSYLALSKGYRVYSVGSDGVDSNGESRQTDARLNDVALAVSR